MDHKKKSIARVAPLVLNWQIDHGCLSADGPNCSLVFVKQSHVLTKPFNGSFGQYSRQVQIIYHWTPTDKFCVPPWMTWHKEIFITARQRSREPYFFSCVFLSGHGFIQGVLPYNVLPLHFPCRVPVPGHIHTCSGWTSLCKVSLEMIKLVHYKTHIVGKADSRHSTEMLSCFQF